MDFKRRIRLLRGLMERNGVDALVVTHLPNVRYLCGFSGSAGALLVGTSRVLFFTDGRYAEQAAKQVAGAKIRVCRGSAFPEAIAATADLRAKNLGFEADYMTVATLAQARRKLPQGVRLKPTEGLVLALRVIKDKQEVALLCDAIRLGARLLPIAYSAIRPGVREVEVAAALEFEARRLGAEGMSFETIVAAGKRSALPHGTAGPARIPAKGFIVLDFGVILGGYCSDMTRTVYLGRAGKRERELYGTVLQAQLASIAACVPGAKLSEVDSAARNVLKKYGLDAHFTHSTGHGVGLEIHEPPRVAQGQSDTLQPGMVVTIEPGIYLAGRCGIRIEDVVAITETGHKVLTPASKELVEL